MKLLWLQMTLAFTSDKPPPAVCYPGQVPQGITIIFIESQPFGAMLLVIENKLKRFFN